MTDDLCERWLSFVDFIKSPLVCVLFTSRLSSKCTAVYKFCAFGGVHFVGWGGPSYTGHTTRFFRLSTFLQDGSVFTKEREQHPVAGWDFSQVLIIERCIPLK